MGWNKGKENEVLVSGARTADFTLDLNKWAQMWDECFFIIDITAKSGTGPTLDIAYQVKSIAGNWVDHTVLAQIGDVTGLFLLKVDNNIGVSSRLNFLIAGTTPSYTFTVTAVGKMSGGRG